MGGEQSVNIEGNAGHGERDGPRSRSNAGFSLIETLIAIVIVGTVLVSAGAAMVTVQRITDQNRITSRVELALTSYGESMKALTFKKCATTTDLTPSDWVAPGFSAGDAPVAVITTVSYWTGSAWRTAAQCAADTANPAVKNSAQQVVITVDWPGRNRTIVGTIIKRDPLACATCPGS